MTFLKQKVDSKIYIINGGHLTERCGLPAVAGSALEALNPVCQVLKTADFRGGLIRRAGVASLRLKVCGERGDVHSVEKRI
jgi:hypothetical protein